MMLTTLNNISGRQIKTSLGLVRGNTIRAKNIGKDIIAAFRNIVGGEIRMIKDAEDLGADAIIGIRFTTSQIMSGAAELLVYGTAVKLGE